MLTIHEAARESFDQKADALLRTLREIDPQTNATPEFRPDVHPVAAFDDEDIKEIPWMKNVREIDQKLLHIDLSVDRKCYRFDECTGFEALCRRIASRPELRRHVGPAAVENGLLAWFKNAIERGQESRFVEFLLERLEPRLKEVEVWVPIANLYLETRLPFGEVVLQPVTSDQIDTWATALPSDLSQEDRAALEKEIRTRLQGHAAAVCHLTAEQSSALEVAAEMAAESVALLRTLSGAMFMPRARSSLQLRGQEHHDAREAWMVGEGTIAGMTGELVRPWPEPLKLSNELVNHMRPHLNDLSSLLAAEPRSEFQKTLIRALCFYSKTALTSDPGKVLLYLMMSLEILLLRDEQEAIQQAIGERVAFVVATEATKRLEIVDCLRKCYGMRSKYVHHGRPPEDLDQIEATH